jgi:FtsZ-interacting cell division protein YlmF
MEMADAKRLVDYMAGLVSAGAGGSIERVSRMTFILSPN